MIKIFAIILLTLACFSSCGPIPEFDLSQNFKDYVFYSQSSYWIYSDSTNYIKKDSVVILENSFKTTVRGPEKPIKVQSLSTRYYSSRDSVFIIDGEQNVYGNMEIPGLGDYGYMDTLTSINYFFVDPGSKNASGYPNSCSVIGNLKVKNRVYSEVLRFNVPDLHKTVYWAKHIGVIKSTYRGITWELDTCVVKQ